ncbi:hypothetical protein BDW75DRAFT_208850 [Aspergillus navahoensis]
MIISYSNTSAPRSLWAASRYSSSRYNCPGCATRLFHSSRSRRASPEPRLEDFGKVIRDEYAVVREHYGQT